SPFIGIDKPRFVTRVPEWHRKFTTRSHDGVGFIDHQSRFDPGENGRIALGHIKLKIAIYFSDFLPTSVFLRHYGDDKLPLNPGHSGNQARMTIDRDLRIASHGI